MAGTQGAGARSAGTLVRGASEGKGRACYRAAACCMGRLPEGEVSLLAPPAATPENACEAGSTSRGERSQEMIAAGGQPHGGDRVGHQAPTLFAALCRRPCAASKKPGKAMPGKAQLMHVAAHMHLCMCTHAGRSMCSGTAATRRIRRSNRGHQPIIWWRSAAGGVPGMGERKRKKPWLARGRSREKKGVRGEGCAALGLLGGRKTHRNSTYHHVRCMVLPQHSALWALWSDANGHYR